MDKNNDFGKDSFYAGLLDKGIQQLGLSDKNISIEALLVYLSELSKWNKVFNLSGIKEAEDHIYRNLLDCLAVLPHISETRLMDIGSGAGLPGIVLAIAEPKQHWLLVDSNGKKTRFLNQVKQKIRLSNVEVENARVENLQTRAGFEALCTRAFDSVPNSLRRCEPVLKKGMRFYAMKGKVHPQDLEGLPAWAEIEKTIALQVPGLDEQRHLIIVKINTERKSSPEA